MHEMALCNAMFDVMLAEAQNANAVRINEVTLVIGEVRDIVEDLFDGFFKYLSKGTIAEGARVEYVRTPLMLQCETCGKFYHISLRDRQQAVCPDCGCARYEMRSGMEFEISSMDVTTEDELEQAVASE